MKNKILSGGIYRESLRRLKAFALIFTALALLFEIAPPIIIGLDNNPDSLISKSTVNFDEMCSFVPFIAVLSAVAVTVIVFSPFNKRAYSDFAHSLPYTRTCIFLSKTAAVYTCVFGLMALSALSGVVAYAAFPGLYALNFSGFAISFLKYVSVATFIVSCFSIAIAVTGTSLSNITVALLIMFFPRFVCFLMTESISSNLPFMCGGYYLPVLSPGYNTLVGMFFPYVLFNGIESYMTDTAPIIYTLLISAIYTVIALVLFKKRKSETAEMPAPGKGVQCAIRVLVSLVFSLPATIIMAVDTDFDDIELSVILYILAVIAYFTYEIITVKSWKKLLHAVPALGIVLLINLLFAGVFAGIKTVAVNFTPTANEIDSVCIDESDIGYDEEKDYFSTSSGVEITDLKVKAAITNALMDGVDAWRSNTYNKYYNGKYQSRLCCGIKKGGVTRYRIIYMTAEDYESLVLAVSNNEAYRKVYMDMPEAITGTVEVPYSFSVPEKEEQNLLDTMQAEIKALGFEKWYPMCRGDMGITTEKYDPCEDILNLSYSVSGYSDMKYNAPVSSVLCPKTFELLMKYSGNDKTKKELEKIVDLLESGQSMSGDDWMNVYIEIVVDGKSYNYQPEYDENCNPIVEKETLSLLENALKSGKEPTAGKHMRVDITVFADELSGQTGYNSKSYAAACYLSLPEDFRIEDYPMYIEESVYNGDSIAEEVIEYD